MAYTPRFMSGTTLVAALALLFTVGFLIFYSPEDREVVRTTDGPDTHNINLAARGTVAEKDTDDDGLADWEEELWKTDSTNPDTDGDGTPDGEEVATGRNPLVAGPDDALAKKSEDIFVAPKQTSESDTLGTTKTDTLARTLFSKYVSLKRISGNLDEENTTAIVNLLSGMVNETLPARFAVSDISISNEDDIRAYGNAVAEAFVKNGTENENELVILQRALDAKNPDALAKLDATVVAYKNTLHDLLSVPVPKAVVTLHLSLVNNLDRTARAIEDMRVVFDDPVTALAAIENYPRYADGFLTSLTDIGNFLKKNVNYSPDEAGYSLTQNI